MWFGPIEWLGVGVIIFAIVGLIWRLQHPQPGYFDDPQPAAITNPQSSAQPTTPSTTQATPVAYLDIKEWGVRLTLNSTTASLYYYIKPNLPDVAYLSLRDIAAVAPDCAADKTALGAIGRLSESQQQYATAHPNALNTPGTAHIGNHWYGFSTSQASCIENSTQDASATKAIPHFKPGILLTTFNTLAADPTMN